jgi:muramoyltetrapeptide carboxypeptidase
METDSVVVERRFRIGLCAPGGPIGRDLADRVRSFVDSIYGSKVELIFHPQCFLSCGHFAGDDVQRRRALVTLANDPLIDAVWFARGGYGSCRVAAGAIGEMTAVARAKRWLGYSDAGFVIAGLQAAGFDRIAHGPMPVDLDRTGGEHALRRSLEWLISGGGDGVAHAARPSAAFNLTVLSQMLGTELEPRLDGLELCLEDVGEYLYRIDRSMFHVMSSSAVRRCAGVRMGRFSQVPPNVPEFGQTPTEIAAHWCERAGVPYLGDADIGHDVDNKVVPLAQPAIGR